METKYQIRTYRINEYHTQQKGINVYENDDNLRANTNNLENIHQAMKLLGYEIYEIFDDSSHPLFKPEVLIKQEQREQQEREQYVLRQQKIVEAWNKQPLILQEWKIDRITIQAERTEAHYDPSHSWNAQYLNVKINILFDGKDTERHHFIDNFFTKDGKFQQKKFLCDARFDLGIPLEYTQQPEWTNILQQLADKLPEIHQAQETLQKSLRETVEKSIQ